MFPFEPTVKLTLNLDMDCHGEKSNTTSFRSEFEGSTCHLLAQAERPMNGICKPGFPSLLERPCCASVQSAHIDVLHIISHRPETNSSYLKWHGPLAEQTDAPIVSMAAQASSWLQRDISE